MAVNNQVTGWVGWVYFAGFILLISGIFQIIAGLAALLNQDFYLAQNGTVVVFDLTTWGWVHVILGIIVMCVGTALFSGKVWARIIAVILASLSLIANFVFISAYPIWSITLIVLDAIIIYALTVHGGEAAIEAEE